MDTPNVVLITGGVLEEYGVLAVVLAPDGLDVERLWEEFSSRWGTSEDYGFEFTKSTREQARQAAELCWKAEHAVLSEYVPPPGGGKAHWPKRDDAFLRYLVQHHGCRRLDTQEVYVEEAARLKKAEVQRDPG